MKTERYSRDDVNLLPGLPGVYRFYNKNEELIYIGKAKNLRKRVNSYFNKSSYINRKTQRLVSEIQNIEFAISNTEFDAFLLENNLIKQHQPKYNIQLKDDKSFPYICVLNERFPRIISTRRFNPKQGTYFGPYSSVVAMNNVLDLIRTLYTIRTCHYDLSEKNIKDGKFKVCLEYHIGNCKGPCEDRQSIENYGEDIKHAINILKGDLGIANNYFKTAMNSHAKNMEFEKALQFKEKLNLLQKFQSKTLVVNKKITKTDVISIISDLNQAFVNFLQIKDGGIIASKTVLVKKKLDEDDGDIISSLTLKLRKLFKSDSKEILSNVKLNFRPINTINLIPQKADKKKLVELSLKNALQFKKDQAREQSRISESRIEILLNLKDDLRLKTIPYHIDCFDNSNIQGSSPVASMVCFINGKPYKKNYRKFKIRTVIGPDDYASMKEIIFRRYKRVLDEKLSLPDLIVVDGGKGQVSAACESLEQLNLYGKVPIIGIAKKLEEIYFPKDPIPLHINKSSSSLKLLLHLRNEAHRFAITFHRQSRQTKSLASSLYEIKGIGIKTIDKLLKRFKSPKKIYNATEDELAKLIGKDKATLIKQFNSE